MLKNTNFQSSMSMNIAECSKDVNNTPTEHITQNAALHTSFTISLVIKIFKINIFIALYIKNNFKFNTV